MSEGAAWAERVTPFWPGASVNPVTSRRGTRRPTGDSGFREFLFLPDARQPRLLLPAGVPAASATALRRYSHGLRTKERLGRSLLATALRTGLPESRLADRLRVSTTTGDSIEDHLGHVLGREVVISVHLGNARINRKPVLHALSPAGESLAFVKVGDSDTARALVRDESAALTFIGSRSFEHITAPRILHYGSWHELTLLVLSPLPTTVRRERRRATLPVEAMQELSGADRADRADRARAAEVSAVGDSTFWRELTDAPPDWVWEGDRLSGPHKFENLSGALTTIGDRYGDVSLAMGPWHGDWTPWNMDWRAGQIQLWDWERFARPAPAGFDALHYRLQDAARTAGGVTTTVLDDWLAGMPAMLEPFGVNGRAASATGALYLAELCKRYLPATVVDVGMQHSMQARQLLSYVVNRAAHI